MQADRATGRRGGHGAVDQRHSAREPTAGQRVAVMDPASFLDTDAVAEILGLSRRTLDRWRVTGAGPSYHKFGNRIRYRWRDVQAWAVASRRRRTLNAG